MATYDQLIKYGIPRGEIAKAIDEAEFLGLIRVERGGRWADANCPSTYQLTFYAHCDGSPATNEWKGKTAEAIKAWKKDRREQGKRKKERREKLKAAPETRTTVVRLSELPKRKMER